MSVRVTRPRELYVSAQLFEALDIIAKGEGVTRDDWANQALIEAVIKRYPTAMAFVVERETKRAEVEQAIKTIFAERSASADSPATPTAPAADVNP
jgi:hypothetical protein